MLFLVSGSSGMGKSTVRELVTPELGERFEAVELIHFGPIEPITIARRQELAEMAAHRAAQLAKQGRHLLLSGDPVAPGEIIAAPSATAIGGIAICLLDADAETQTERLARRGDPADQLPLHVGFATWMREHAKDPIPRLDVLTSQGSNIMQWDRLAHLKPQDPRWIVHLIDTSGRSKQSVADDVREWIGRAMKDDRLVMRPELWGT